jgi:MoaA/NifB/PqqE/SkfB family radical SAM enzyme
MKIAYVVLENRCNLTCPYCFYVQRGDRWSKDRMGLETVRSVVAQLAELGFGGVAFTGGEPTLHPDLVACVDAAHSYGMRTWIATNGTRLSDELCHDLRAAGLDNVYLSSNTAVPVEEALASLDNAIGQLRAAGLDAIHLTWVISRPDTDVLERVRAFARLHEVDVVFQPAWLVHDGTKVSRLDQASLHHITPVLIDWAREAGHVGYAQLMLGYYARGNRPSSCTMGSSRVVIDWNGDVYPCFHRKDLRAGNVGDGPLSAILGDMAESAVPQISSAACFGEHCISLFAGSDRPRLATRGA